MVGLYKTKLIRRRDPWHSLDEWSNLRRLHSAVGGVPPAEFDDVYYRQRQASTAA